MITREYEPVTKPLEEIVAWELENVRIRPGFKELVELARDRGWRFVIVSSGFHELIEPILEHEGVEVELHANRVDPRPDGWRVLWQYDEACDSAASRASARSCRSSRATARSSTSATGLRPLRGRGLRPRLRDERPGPLPRGAGESRMSASTTSTTSLAVSLPEPFDFELSTERYRAFGPDLANLWHEGGIHRVFEGQEVRIEPGEGGARFEPGDPARVEPVRRYLGARSTSTPSAPSPRRSPCSRASSTGCGASARRSRPIRTRRS